MSEAQIGFPLFGPWMGEVRPRSTTNRTNKIGRMDPNNMGSQKNKSLEDIMKETSI